MFIFTAILNVLCLNGYTKVVWFIVIIPIILLTYISSVLFYIFGINPGKNNVNIQKPQEQQPQPQPQPQPQQQQLPLLKLNANPPPPIQPRT